MNPVSAYDAIHSINAELNGYRKGSLSVFIDLDKGYLTWRESTRWCNNFTRTITPEQIQAIRRDLESCRLLNWRNMREKASANAPADTTADAAVIARPPARLAWQVRVRHDGKAWFREGENRLPGQWDAFCAAIERLSRTSFRL